MTLKRRGEQTEWPVPGLLGEATGVNAKELTVPQSLSPWSWALKIPGSASGSLLGARACLWFPGKTMQGLLGFVQGHSNAGKDTSLAYFCFFFLFLFFVLFLLFFLFERKFVYS